MNTQKFYYFIFIALLAFSCTNNKRPATKICMSPIFSDNMVLQQKEPVNIWGKASPGGIVQVSFKDQTKRTVTGNDST